MSNTKAKFWERVQKTDGCWLWTGAKNGGGYGVFHLGRQDGKQLRAGAHRYSYALHNGPIPAGMDVLHKCDNPACVNPDHLFLGTQADNDADRNAKGRQAKGARMGAAKLTEGQVLAIRRAYADGRAKLKKLAAEYGVSAMQIWRVVSRQQWTYLP